MVFGARFAGWTEGGGGAVMRKLPHLIYGVIKSGQVFAARLATRNLISKMAPDPRPLSVVRWFRTAVAGMVPHAL